MHTPIPAPGSTEPELLEWLESLMRLTGWSPSRLAKESGLAASTVNRFLAGAGHLLSTTSIGRIQAAAGRRIRERVAAGEIAWPEDFKTRAGEPADRLVLVQEVDPRRGDGVSQEWGFPEHWFRFTFGSDPAACRVVAIEDDAMYGELRTGDRVVVDLTRTEPSPPGIFLIDDGVCWTPRHLELLPETEPRVVMVRARHPDYRSREVPLAALKIAGRVMGMWRRV